MKIFTIAKQEWSDKRMAWGAAFVVGLLCYAAPGLLGDGQMPLQDGRAVASVSVAFIFAGFMALICGAGMIAPDLQEGRFGFFLSRPVKSAELFFGKWMGASSVSLGVGLLVLLPTSLARLSQELILPNLVPLVMLASLGSMVGHAFSTSLRARSVWMLLDAITLLLFGSEMAWFAWRLTAVNALWEWVVLLVITIILCTVGLGFVGWRQVASARTDLKGSHRVLSLGAMVVMALLGLGGWLFVWKAGHVDAKTMGPASLSRVGRQGPWLSMTTESWLPRLEGPKEDSDVLLNVETGRGIRTGWKTLMSANGNRAVWRVSTPFAKLGAEIWMAELGRVSARVRGTGIQIANPVDNMVLSADGRKLATVEGSAIVIYDLDTGLLVARGPVESALFMNVWRNRLLFVGPDLLRCYVGESTSKNSEDPISIREMDLQNGRLRETGRISLPGEGWTVIADRNPVLDLLLVTHSNNKSRQVYLCDAHTGAIKQTLAPEGENPLFRAEFLSDGSIVMAGVTGWESGNYWAKHFDATGHELTLLHLGAAPRPGPGGKRYIRLGAESKPGLVLVRTTETHDSKTYSHQHFEVDFKTNTVREISGQEYKPARSTDDLLGPVAPGSLPTRIFFGPDQALSVREGDHLRPLTKGREGAGKGR